MTTLSPAGVDMSPDAVSRRVERALTLGAMCRILARRKPVQDTPSTPTSAPSTSAPPHAAPSAR